MSTDDDAQELAPAPLLGWLQTALGLTALVLAIITVVQSGQNRSLQSQVEATQIRLSKSATFANLDNSLIQLLAKAAVENNDGALRDLLAANGVTIQSKPPSSSSPAPSQ